MQWRSVLEPLHQQDTKNYIAEILDAETDGNYTDALAQEWSVRLIGWDVQLDRCRAMVPQGGYNGQGQYRNYKRGDVVIVSAREGQLEEALIIGSIRLNGEQSKLEEQGQGLKYGEMVTGSSGQPVPANQVSLHPTRVTKMDSDIKIHGSNNLTDVFTDPTLNSSLEDRQAAQPLPGVVETVNKEGVYALYAHGGIVNYTDGNIVNVSNGSKQNKCTKFLEQAKRHLSIAAQLESLSILRIENIDTVFEVLDNGEATFSELPGFDSGIIGEANKFEGEFSLFKGGPVFDPINARPITEQVSNDNLSKEKAIGNPINQTSSETDREDQQTKDGLEVRNPLYRAQKHKELAKLAQKLAEACNQESAAFQQQANLMAESVGNHFGNGGLARDESIPEIPPSQFFGNTDPNNFGERDNGNGVSKPPVISEPANPANYPTGSTNNPDKIFLHHTAGSLNGTIQNFRDPLSKVSAHYTVARDGRIFQHVPDNKRAQHAKAGNANSIGIEHVAWLPNQGLTPAQEASTVSLIKYLVSTYNISKSNIRGHRTVVDTLCPSYIWPSENNLRNWVNNKI